MTEPRRIQEWKCAPPSSDAAAAYQLALYRWLIWKIYGAAPRTRRLP